jgi:rod shape-determining protein MreB
MDFKPGDLAIDMGSVTSLVSAKGSDEIYRVPSLVVRYVADPNKVVAVGNEALPYIGRIPPYLEVRKPVREGRILDEDAFIALMKHLLHLVHPGYTKVKAFLRPTALIAVPITTPTELKALASLVERKVGVKALLITQPGAAAIGAGMDYTKAVTCALFDVGGSTTDFATLSNRLPTYQNSLPIGGDYFDDEIQRGMLNDKHIKISRFSARQVKHEIGCALPFPELKKVRVSGLPINNGAVSDGKAIVTSEEVRQWLQKPLARLSESISRELGMVTSEDVFADIVDRGLTLTGGTSLLHRLSEHLSCETSREFHPAENPFDTVLLGTKIIMEDRSLRKFFNLLHQQ